MQSREHSLPSWVITGSSVRGVAHAREGLPNQDAITTWSPPDGRPLPAIIAVADGHGGARHFRSAIGARAGVNTATAVLHELAGAIDAANVHERSRLAAVDIPVRIASRWAAHVRGLLAETPLIEAELRALEDAEGPAARAAVQADPLLAYGATLLAAMVTERCVVLTQLGDGDILTVGPDGATTRPLPQDERLIGSRTTSLCQPGAENDFRSIVLTPERAPLSLILLSTDGYANSFKTNADFLQVGSDFLEMIHREGIEAVGAQLPGILLHASENGSGDDITLGLMQYTTHQGSTRSLPDKSLTWSEPASPNSASRSESSASTLKIRKDLARANDRIHTLKSGLIAAAIAGALAIGWAAWSHFRSDTPSTPESPLQGAKAESGHNKPAGAGGGGSRGGAPGGGVVTAPTPYGVSDPPVEIPEFPATKPEESILRSKIDKPGVRVDKPASTQPR